MSMDLIRILLLTVDEVILIYIVFRAFRNVRRQADDVPAAFLAFAVVSYLVNGFYWIMFSLMHGHMRMPFSVADFSEDGSLLLMASVLTSAFPEKEKGSLRVTLGAALFAIGNIVLWNYWNGEWVKNIMGGLCYAYLVWHTARALWISGALSRRDWIVWGVACAALLAGQFLLMALPSWLESWMNGWMYALMLAGTVFLTVRTIRAVKTGEDRRKAISLAVAGSVWTTTCVYMCEEPAWFVAESTVTFTIALLTWAMERREGAL